jgi:hypothetical protein
METLANEATLDVTNEAGRHHVDWTALEDTPGTFRSFSSCNAGAGVGAGIVRDAVARGRVHGQAFRSQTSAWNFNGLWAGPHASQCEMFSDRDLRDIMDGGSFTIHRTFDVSE